MDEAAMVFWLQDPEPAKWHGRSPFVRQPAYSLAQDRSRHLETALRSAHTELTNHGHQELSECECAIARILNGSTNSGSGEPHG